MESRTLRFIRGGELVSLTNVPSDRTLLELLREDLAATGTKEGCGEGDCGACTVVVAEPRAGRLAYRAINACIRLAHSIDGMALWTVEDLAGADGSLRALDAATGEPTWEVELPEAAPFGSPTVGFGRVFVVDGLGRLQAIPFAADQETWKWMPRPRDGAIEKLAGVASIHGARLYVTTASGALLALDLKDADGPAPWPVPGGTAARNGRVFVAEE